MTESSTSRAKLEQKGANMPNYQEEVKSKEFLDFLKGQGIIPEEVAGGASRQVRKEDSATIKERLHIGVQILISNSKKVNRVQARRRLELLLVDHASHFQAAMFDYAEADGMEIAHFIKEEEEKMIDSNPSAENMEIDFYVHGWAEKPLSPVKSSHKEIMGIGADVIPLHMGTPESRPAMSLKRPQHMTPSMKGDSNVVNVGEAAGTSDECLPKKVAQLERALTYAHYRAGKDDIEEAVGYGALCMSMVDGSSLASAMISLHADMFPLLARMQKKGGLAYLFSRRTIFSDVQKAMEGFGGIQQELQNQGRELKTIKQQMQIYGRQMQIYGVVVLIGFAWLIWRK